MLQILSVDCMLQVASKVARYDRYAYNGRVLEIMTDSIVIKGISQGVLAILSTEEEWSGLVSDLVDLIDRRGAFFKGAQLVVDVKDRLLTPNALQGLKAQLQEREVQLAAVLSANADTESATHELDLVSQLEDVVPPAPPFRNSEVESAGAADEYELPEFDSEEYGTAGVLIKRTIRSGRTVRSKGHVVVIGDVNSGAEIVAIGDVVVWGKLRGVVHAGAQGDENVVVCALDLAPTQLRIANLITIPPQEGRTNAKPEMAHVSNGQIEAIPWL